MSELSKVTYRVKDKGAEGRSDSQALILPTTGYSHSLSYISLFQAEKSYYFLVHGYSRIYKTTCKISKIEVPYNT